MYFLDHGKSAFRYSASQMSLVNDVISPDTYGLRSWMEFLVSGLQAIVGNVRVNLRGVDVTMTEHHLYGSQVCAVFDQRAGETVSQHMWRDMPEPS